MRTPAHRAIKKNWDAKRNKKDRKGQKNERHAHYNQSASRTFNASIALRNAAAILTSGRSPDL
ncbi:MAG TPA: hypothetical protein PLP93_04675 [Nitrosomonas sp.]|nr:hypothetical protein [Nitrosomonas sp.]HRB45288.1 hypothetical protein [Nitrosomonas sp.]HRB76420.1 hypothetical protein [Nitrosomonas sp.]